MPRLRLPPTRHRSACAWRRPAASGCLAWALAAWSVPATAQQPGSTAVAPLPSAASRITQVLVYPGGAVVERVARVAAGAPMLQIGCLPAGLDAATLVMAADAGITLGDVSLRPVALTAAPECNSHPLDARIRELEDQKAALTGEHAAHELVLGYLKAYGGADRAAAAGPAAPGATLAQTAEALRRTGQDALARQHQLDRRREQLDQQLAPLLAERSRLPRAQGQVQQLTLRLAAQREGEVRISYQVSQAGWTPSYRAHLDTASSQLRLERLGLVAQSSGEDWTGVRLRLSTAQPRQATGLRPPTPWTLAIRSPITALPATAPRAMAAMAAPAPAPIGLSGSRGGAEAAFDTSVFEGAFATEFEVPGPVSLPSHGPTTSFTLARGEPQAAQLFTRVQPQQEAQAYLLAEVPRPTGAWPAGPMQLYRDGGLVGQSRLQLGSDERLSVFFGRDERLRVDVAPEALGGAQTGFIGTRAERRVQRRYTLDNLHNRPLNVQVLEPSPVAQHDDIRIEARYSPDTEAWRQQPGIRVWQASLAPGQRWTLSADYLISHPKDAPISERR